MSSQAPQFKCFHPPPTTNLTHPPFTFNAGRFEPGGLRDRNSRRQRSGAARGAHSRGPRKASNSRSTSRVGWRQQARFGVRAAEDRRTFGHDDPGTTLPVTFSVEGGAQLLGESPISAEARIATILLNTGSRGGWLRIRAQAGELAGQLSTAARKAVRPMWHGHPARLLKWQRRHS